MTACADCIELMLPRHILIQTVGTEDQIREGGQRHLMHTTRLEGGGGRGEFQVQIILPNTYASCSRTVSRRVGLLAAGSSAPEFVIQVVNFCMKKKMMMTMTMMRLGRIESLVGCCASQLVVVIRIRPSAGEQNCNMSSGTVQ